MERRSPTGIARERETRPNNAAPHQSPGCERRIADLRRITGTMERRSPTGIARERETRPNNAAPHQSPGCERRIATRAESRGRRSAGLRPASRGSAKPAPMTVRRTDLSGAPPAQSGLRCSLRFAQRCRPEVGVPVPARCLCSIRTAPLAPLRGAVPTRGRRSRACASLVLNQDCAARPAARGGADRRSAFPCLRVMVPVGVPAEMRRPGARFALRR